MKYVEILARNVLFTKDTEDFFNVLLEKSINDRVKKYINKTLKNYIINEYKGTLIKRVPANSPDWLKKALAEKQEVFSIKLTKEQKDTLLHYLTFLNGYSISNTKDIKFSYNELERQVKEWDKKIKSNQESSDFILIKDYGSYKWVELTTKKGIKNEGSNMGHCLKDKSTLYYGSVKDKSMRLFSLRDSSNKPHVTVEYNTNKKMIAQIQGKQDGSVPSKYLIYVLDILNNNSSIEVKDVSKADLLRHDIMKVGSEYKRFSTLDSYTFESSYSFNKHYADNVFNYELPEHIYLPKKLIVNGDFVCTNKYILHGDELEINGDLYINESIENFNRIKANDITIRHTDNISKLPDTIESDYTLELHDMKITKLPKNLKIGSLSIKDTDIKEIPNIKLHSLYIVNSPISSIPDIEVYKLVIANGTNIKELNPNIKVKELRVFDKNIKIPKKLQKYLIED